MGAVIIPFAGLACVPLLLWLVVGLSEAHHVRVDGHARELRLIDAWVDAIRAGI